MTSIGRTWFILADRHSYWQNNHLYWQNMTSIGRIWFILAYCHSYWQNIQSLKSVLPFCSALPIQYTLLDWLQQTGTKCALRHSMNTHKVICKLTMRQIVQYDAPQSTGIFILNCTAFPHKVSKLLTELDTFLCVFWNPGILVLSAKYTHIHTLTNYQMAASSSVTDKYSRQ